MRSGALTAAMRGPLVLARPWTRGLAIALLVVLTLLTEVGGLIAWPLIGLVARPGGTTPRWMRVVAALLAYFAIVVLVVPLAAAPFDRVPLPCMPGGALAPRSIVFCLASRNYVVPALRDDALAIAADVRVHDPDGSVLYLDGSFPLPGLPILPHLSHGDGRRLDLALPFEDGTGSPIGYFGYAPLPGDVAPACPPDAWDRRWDLDALQPLFGPPRLDVVRASRLVRAAVARPGIARVLLEPHVMHTLAVRSDKIHFQGCAAARHDDHVHLEEAER